MKLRKRITAITTALIMAAIPMVRLMDISLKTQAESTDIFYDDFSNGLDTDKWLVAYKNWGGKVTVDGEKVDYNGGVLPQNIDIENGRLILKGNGNLYEGDVRGINRDMTLRDNGKRTGAAIATKDYYASGSYEVYAKVAPELGACSAIWTFEYEEDWDTGEIINHEIDIEMPGRPKASKTDQSFNYALCNTWVGENEGEYKTGYTDIGINQADGEFHKYRFDWHTGGDNEEARVEFYFDDVLTYTSYEYVPQNAGRLWLGLWFPNEWAGVPDFDSTAFEIDWVKITPFHESGDKPQNETYPDDGWADESMIPDFKSVKGDVNADGVFSIADVVTMQKWILAVPDVTLKNWQAGDLCKDDRIDIFDLCMMKQLLLSQEKPVNPLAGMLYDDAVKNGYISKSEYNYQITGGLKSTIEAKMGRQLDYSIDRFYLVNNEKIGFDSSTKYLYNAETKDIYAVTEETPMNCATWYWKGTKAAEYGLDDDMEKQNEFLDAMEFYGINEIYYSIGANKLVSNYEMVSAFVRNAYARDMKVYLVTGNKTWLYEDSYETAIYNVFNKVAEYNSLVASDARIAGVSYDAEVWTNSEYDWKNNADARKQQVKFIETAQAYAESKNLSVSHCLPFWIVRYDYTDDEGVIRNVYDSITQIANETILMIYRDTPAAIEKLAVQVQTNAENPVIYYNEKNDCNLEIGVQADENSEGDYVSFYEEEKENPGYILGAISTIKDDLSEYENRITFAIHQATALYEYYLTK